MSKDSINHTNDNQDFISKKLQTIYNITIDIIKTLGNDEILSLYSNMQSGKMLRSKLVLSIVDNDMALKLCAIIELIQAASLLHDDVIDESDTRRGRASINAMFGNKNAIMLGDILYSSAFHELSKMESSIAQSLSLSVCKLSMGEIADVSLESCFNDNEDKYLNMIELKSASLIAASSECAALLAGFKNHRDYYEYGLNLGMAFQIIDDILDIVQSSQTLGKPALSDFASGKSTLPYIYLYESLDSNNKEWLLSLFKIRADSKDEGKLLDLMKSSGALERAKQKALHYGNLSLQISRKINNKKLESLITSMIERSF